MLQLANAAFAIRLMYLFQTSISFLQEAGSTKKALNSQKQFLALLTWTVCLIKYEHAGQQKKEVLQLTCRAPV